MTRGRCGSLIRIRMTFAFTTPRRFNRRTRSIPMRRIFLFLLICISSATSLGAQQKLSVRWEELTADDFRRAIDLSKGTCILPIGILEKHGPHLPLGTDLLNV